MKPLCAIDFKAKYAAEWPRSNAREAVAVAWLKLMGIEARPSGHGALTAGLLPGFHRDALDKFDFFDPAIPAFFEVTGTGWQKHQSARRFRAPVIPVLKSKVDYASYYGVERYLWFIAVAENQGEVRFLPCRLVSQYPYGYYARGEGDYYLVPWDAWWAPAWARREFEKRREKLARRLEACPSPA